MKKKMLLVGTLIIASSLVFSACAKQSDSSTSTQPLNADVVSSTVVAEGMLIPQQDVTLTFVTSGTVTSIRVSKGDAVKAGDVLMTIGDQTQLEAQQKSIAADLINAQQALDDLNQNAGVDKQTSWKNLMDAQEAFNDTQKEYDDLNEDTFEDDLQNAEEDVIDAQQDVQDAQADLQEYLDLDKDNSTRQRYEDDLKDAQDTYNEKVRAKSEIQLEHDRIVNAYQDAEAVLAVAQAEYDKRQDGPDTDMLVSLTAQINSLQASQSAVEEQLAKMSLTAPFDGQVMEIYIDESEFASPAQPMIVIASTDQWLVETTDLTELEVVNIKEGQPVSIEAEAYPGVTFSGTVESIGSYPKMDQGDVLYTVRIKVNMRDLPALKWGMSVTITFEEE
ncbi:MAG: HlyD family secretion protein [Anaerolineaceae bacterium]